ncbi:g4630 [Coccomyxa elongata]
MTSKRQKSTEESPEETSNVKSLPKVPESEVQEFKSMYLFKSAGTGKVLEVSDSSKKQAEELFASLDISLIDLPTGADWPVLPLVTPEGLLVHFVEKSAVLAVQSRDPSHLSGQKHSRCGEE